MTTVSQFSYASKTVPFSLLTEEQKRLRILGFPGETQPVAPMITGVYYPSPEELEKYRQRGVIVDKVVELTNGNGEVIKAAVDENGEVVDAEKKQPNIAGLAIAAAILFAVLGG
jgi:hypothetical protein